MPQPIEHNVIFDDLSARFLSTQTVTGSPAAGSETIVATLTIPSFNDIAVVTGVQLRAWAAFTVGTNGVTATLKLRQTDASGSTIATSGACTVVATNLLEMSIQGFDAAPGIGKYVATLTIGSGSAASTVSAVNLSAIVI